MSMLDIKTLDALRTVDRTQGANWVDLEDMQRALKLEPNYDPELSREFQSRTKSYWVMKWMCTDTWVGLQAVFFDGELTALIYQEARKSWKEIQFTSAHQAQKMFEFLTPKFDASKIDFLNSSEIIDPLYHVQFANQLLADEGYYKDEKVKVIRWTREDKRPTVDQEVKIKHSNGTEEVIQVEELKLPIACTANPHYQLKDCSGIVRSTRIDDPGMLGTFNPNTKAGT